MRLTAFMDSNHLDLAFGTVEKVECEWSEEKEEKPDNQAGTEAHKFGLARTGTAYHCIFGSFAAVQGTPTILKNRSLIAAGLCSCIASRNTERRRANDLDSRKGSRLGMRN